MDLLRRLYHIARAQVNAGKRVEQSEPHFRQERYTPPPPVVDPKLVGYYANLEIPYGSDLETARQAWKRLLKKCHPDLHAGDPEKRRIANELSAELTRAYQEIERALAREKR